MLESNSKAGSPAPASNPSPPSSLTLTTTTVSTQTRRCPPTQTASSPSSPRARPTRATKKSNQRRHSIIPIWTAVGPITRWGGPGPDLPALVSYPRGSRRSPSERWEELTPNRLRRVRRKLQRVNPALPPSFLLPRRLPRHLPRPLPKLRLDLLPWWPEGGKNEE